MYPVHHLLHQWFSKWGLGFISGGGLQKTGRCHLQIWGGTILENSTKDAFLGASLIERNGTFEEIWRSSGISDVTSGHDITSRGSWTLSFSEGGAPRLKCLRTTVLHTPFYSNLQGRRAFDSVTVRALNQATSSSAYGSIFRHLAVFQHVALERSVAYAGWGYWNSISCYRQPST